MRREDVFEGTLFIPIVHLPTRQSKMAFIKFSLGLVFIELLHSLEYQWRGNEFLRFMFQLGEGAARKPETRLSLFNERMLRDESAFESSILFALVDRGNPSSMSPLS